MADQASNAGAPAPAQTSETPASAPAQTPQAEVQAKPQYIEIKADGKVHKLTEEQLRVYASKGLGADRKFEDAAKMRREREQFEEMLEKNPRAFIEKKLGKEKANQLYQEALYDAIMAERMTPEQRALVEKERALKEKEQEIENWKQEQEKAQMDAMEKQYMAEYDKSIATAIMKAGLPKTTRTVKRMAELMYKNLEHDIDLPADDVVQLVKEDYIREFQELFGQAEGDALFEIFGEGPSKKMRERDLARLASVGSKKPEVEVKAVNNNATSGQDSGPGKPLTMEEWEDMMEKRKQALTDR